MRLTDNHETLDALEYVDAREVPILESELAEEFLAADYSAAPLRRAIRARDDLSFLGEIRDQLVASGVAATLAPGITAALVLDPAVSATSGERLLQAAVFAIEDDFPIRVRVTCRLTVTPASREVHGVAVNVLPVDMDRVADINALAVEAAQYGLDYPSPRPSRTATTRFSVRVLGRPLGGACSVGAHSWNDLIHGLARPFGVEIKILTDQSKVQDAFPASTKVTVALDPAFVGVAMKVGNVPSPTILDCFDKSAEDVAAEIAGLIRSTIELEEAVIPPSATKTLQPGERVFHRKIGTSPAFDRFGDACKPCKHGDSRYRRYHAAPKAEKGMARLYSNFDPSMLYHCGRGYGCGMYAVFAPTSLE